MTAPQTTGTGKGSGGGLLLGLFLLQLAVAWLIGTQRLLTNDGAFPVPPIALSAVIPVAVFLGAYAGSVRWRRLIEGLDLRILTMTQHWRVVGFAFLPLYAYGVLPGLFAWPAGLGDVAVGLAAILVVTRLDRDPGYATSAGFRAFHFLGLFDFAVAVGTAGLASGAVPALTAGGPSSAPMDVWPLNIFPSLFVPAFIILHLIVLLRLPALRRRARSGAERTAVTR